MSKVWRIIDIIKWAENYFSQNRFANPKLEIEWLLRSLLECSRLDIYLRFEEPLDIKQLSVLKGWINRRIKKKEPLQYITGSCEFYGKTYNVNSKVFIPRQETERVIDLAIEKSNLIENPYILDIGTGSGCIALTCASEIPNSKVFGIDISSDALQIAEENKSRLRLKNVYFTIVDILIDIPYNSSRKYDLLASNPPYVSKKEMKNISKEIKNFEPHTALTDFEEGLIFYHRFAELGRRIVNGNGWMILEVGLGNHPNEVLSIFKDSNYRNVKLVKDFNGDNRVLIAQV